MATELGRPYQQQVLVHAGIWIENAIMLLSGEYQAFFWGQDKFFPGCIQETTPSDLGL